MQDAADLSLLRDIVSAPPVSVWWPLPPALVLVAVACVCALAATCLRAWRYRRQNRYRRLALGELARFMRAQQASPAPHAQAALLTLRGLLKRSAMAAYGRNPVAALHGDAWWRFLDAQLGAPCFCPTLGPAVDACCLQRHDDESGAAQLLPELAQASERWLRHHRSAPAAAVVGHAC